MKAMIFAAGLGSRLAPLTNSKPKALVEVKGKPMLGHLIHRIAKTGINEFVINVHHFAEQIVDYLNEPEFADYQIIIVHEKQQLLETGGGLLNAKKYLVCDEPILIHNVDIWSDIDFTDLLKFHMSNKAVATLAVRNRKTSRYLLFDQSNLLCGWENQRTGEMKIARNSDVKISLAFSGIHIISQQFLHLMTGSGAFSIIDTFLQLAENYPILAYNHSHGFWLDLGKPEAIDTINKLSV
jgi:NDP-sugar pyrophosphorylase family protein